MSTHRHIIRVLAIRPPDRWDDTRAALDPLGIQMEGLDVLVYTPTSQSWPVDQNFNGCIITSRRAVAGLPPPLDQPCPLYVVGEQTAQAVIQAGWPAPTIISPTGDDLVRHLAAMPSQHLIYLRGDDVAVDMAAALPHHTIYSHIVYHSTPRAALDPVVAKLLHQDHYQAVLFFSKASAAAFAQLAQKAGVTPALARVAALTLSPSVLQSVTSITWASTHCAATPDLSGMVAAVAAWQKDCVMTQPTTKTPLTPADPVIEQFGGLRPMASKLGIPVTTIQGWKKRGFIPENRVAHIRAAAVEHGVTWPQITWGDTDEVAQVTLPSVPPVSPSVTTDDRDGDDPGPTPIDRPFARFIPSGTEEPSPKTIKDVPPVQIPAIYDVSPEDHGQEPSRPQRRQVDRNVRAVWISAIILAVAVLLGLGVMGVRLPDMIHQNDRLQAMQTEILTLQEKIAALEQTNQMLSPMVPPDWPEKWQAAQARAEDIERVVQNLDRKATALAQSVMGDDTGTIEQRLSTVEQNLERYTDLLGSSSMAQVMDRLQTAQSQPDQAAMLMRVRDQMLDVLQAAPAGSDPVSLLLAKTAPADLRDYLSGVRPDDVVKAGLLLALSQGQQALSRDRIPLDRDLALIKGLSPDLALPAAPWAARGVLTPQGLSREFRVLEPALLNAAAQDPSLSWFEKAQGQLHQVLRLERQGQSITGTTAQKAVERAKLQFDRGDLSGALQTLQVLDGPAAALAAPMMAEAEATMAARALWAHLTAQVAADLSVTAMTPDLQSWLRSTPDATQILERLKENLATPR